VDVRTAQALAQQQQLATLNDYSPLMLYGLAAVATMPQATAAGSGGGASASLSSGAGAPAGSQNAASYFDDGASVMAAPTTSWVPSVDPTLGAGTFEDLNAGAVEEPAPMDDTRVADVPVIPMASTSAAAPVAAAPAPIRPQPEAGLTEEVSEATAPAPAGVTIESPPSTASRRARLAFQEGSPRCVPQEGPPGAET
jgi:hypothetical protein